MNKNLERLSALYDGELSRDEMQEMLKEMDSDKSLRNTFHRLGVISELVQRHSDQQNSTIINLRNYFRKIKHILYRHLPLQSNSI